MIGPLKLTCNSIFKKNKAESIEQGILRDCINFWSIKDPWSCFLVGISNVKREIRRHGFLRQD